MKEITENLGLPVIRVSRSSHDRSTMPQVGDDLSALFKWCHNHNIGVHHLRVKASELHPTQNEINLNLVIDLLREDKQSQRRVVVISSDNKIIDGHHHWYGWAIEQAMVPVVRLERTLEDLLPRLSAAFPVRSGIKDLKG